TALALIHPLLSHPLYASIKITSVNQLLSHYLNESPKMAGAPKTTREQLKEKTDLENLIYMELGDATMAFQYYKRDGTYRTRERLLMSKEWAAVLQKRGELNEVTKEILALREMVARED
ncbi:hypothetical protein C7212DRAFT_329255, partial [Tuber magnatum]